MYMHLAPTSLKVMAFLSCLFLSIPCLSLNAQGHTVGLIQYDPESFKGYTLFAPMGATTTYLIDNYGRLVHSWESDYQPMLSAYLLENGDLLRSMRIPLAGEPGGGVQRISWDGTVIWEFPFYGIDYVQHHDIEPLPNGNVLILASENRTYSEAVAQGRDPALMSEGLLSPEFIVEVEPAGPTSGNIVWEWHIWDHLIQDFDSTRANYGAVADHPELLDINFAKHSRADWIHANAVAYNPELDQIMISSRALNEIWVIDHSTSSIEAAGHTGGQSGMGGDILYRWGKPQAYRAGNGSDQQFFSQHDAHWIESGLPGEGNIIVFNNGAQRPGGNHSTIDEIAPPVDNYGNYQQPAPGTAYGPTQPTWSYQADPPSDFYSSTISGAQRLPNGNTLICSGSKARFFEVTPDGDIVWEYFNPVSDIGILSQGDAIPPEGANVFKCTRFTSNYSGFDGRELFPGGMIELYPISIAGVTHTPQLPSATDSVRVTASISSDNEIISAELYVDSGAGFYSIDMYDDGMHHDNLAADGIYGAAIQPLPESTEVSYYVEAVDDSGSIVGDPTIAPFATYTYITGPVSHACGDANSDETVNVSDAVFIINYVFTGGAAPDPIESGDANCDSTCNVSDAVWIINYVFTGGNEPCDSDGDHIPDC
jgi:hypothetical protein